MKALEDILSRHGGNKADLARAELKTLREELDYTKAELAAERNAVRGISEELYEAMTLLADHGSLCERTHKFLKGASE